MRWPTISNLNRRILTMTDNNHPRFANLRTGGNMPRKRPGLIRDAISLLLIIAMCVAFYVVTP
jgi:hypothetical protein